MNRSAIAAAAALGIALALSAGCKGNEDKDAAAAAAEKKAQETAAAELKQPVALIAAYVPYLRPVEDKDPYLPKRRPDEERSTAFVANEIRHAANKARQKLSGDAVVTKELTAALQAVTVDCADAADPDALGKCAAAVQKLDDALKKSEAASGGSVKFPRVAPDSVTPEAKTAIAPFLKAKGPGDAEKAYVKKRSDSSTSIADLTSACQAAADDADSVSKAFEKAEEPIRLIAVTRKMSMDSQCSMLTTMDTLRKDVNDCRKKAKTPDCKVACGKAKAKVEDGVPAAAFTPLAKDVADICKE